MKKIIKGIVVIGGRRYVGTRVIRESTIRLKKIKI